MKWRAIIVTGAVASLAVGCASWNRGYETQTSAVFGNAAGGLSSDGGTLRDDSVELGGGRGMNPDGSFAAAGHVNNSTGGRLQTGGDSTSAHAAATGTSDQLRPYGATPMR